MSGRDDDAGARPPRPPRRVSADHGDHGGNRDVGFRRERGGVDCGFIINRPAAARARSWRRLRRGDGCPAAVAPGHKTFWFVRRPVGRRERLAHERTGERYVRTNKRPRRRRRGTARRITAITAIRTDHGGHGRPRPNVSDGVHGGRREGRTRERYCRTTHTGERTSERTNRPAVGVLTAHAALRGESRGGAAGVLTRMARSLTLARWGTDDAYGAPAHLGALGY